MFKHNKCSQKIKNKNFRKKRKINEQKNKNPEENQQNHYPAKGKPEKIERNQENQNIKP
jgi:hypothetical protein